MIDFITLQTDSDSRRKVSISYTDDDEECSLLGVLPHQTKFKRADLVKFAKDILAKFEPTEEYILCTCGLDILRATDLEEVRLDSADHDFYCRVFLDPEWE